MDDYPPPPLPPPFLSHEQVQHLVSHHGFIIGVDLPAKLSSACQSLFRSSSAFFAQDESVKQNLYPQSQGTELGWYKVPQEKEFLSLRHARQYDGDSSVPELEADAKKVWGQTAGLLHRILLDIGRDLMIDPEAWQPVLDGCLVMPSSLEDSGPTLLRLLHYLPDTGFADRHVDLGLLTLCFGSGSGLQVWKAGEGETGEWIDADGPTVLTGRTLHMLSSGRVQPGRHRVVSNPEGRDSIVFPLRTSIRHNIPLEPFGGWGSVHGRDLDRIVREDRVNVNATQDVREKQRLALQKEVEAGQG